MLFLVGILLNAREIEKSCCGGCFQGRENTLRELLLSDMEQMEAGGKRHPFLLDRSFNLRSS